MAHSRRRGGIGGFAWRSDVGKTAAGKRYYKRTLKASAGKAKHKRARKRTAVRRRRTSKIAKLFKIVVAKRRRR